jgi:putative endonuclease
MYWNQSCRVYFFSKTNYYLFMRNNISTGKFGEQLAKDFLIKHGYEIVTGHWQKRVGEIDVVALEPDRNELVFVEVKTRTSTAFGYPEETVDKRKLEKIYKTAQWFLFTNQYPDEQAWRIDVISIILDKTSQKAEITHFKNVGLE